MTNERSTQQKKILTEEELNNLIFNSINGHSLYEIKKIFNGVITRLEDCNFHIGENINTIQP